VVRGSISPLSRGFRKWGLLGGVGESKGRVTEEDACKTVRARPVFGPPAPIALGIFSLRGALNKEEEKESPEEKDKRTLRVRKKKSNRDSYLASPIVEKKGGKKLPSSEKEENMKGKAPLLL